MLAVAGFSFSIAPAWTQTWTQNRHVTGGGGQRVGAWRGPTSRSRTREGRQDRVGWSRRPRGVLLLRGAGGVGNVSARCRGPFSFSKPV